MRKHFSVLTVLLLLLASFGFSAVKVGEPVLERFETPHPYSGEGVVVEKIYHHPNSAYISLHFSSFDLAPGDYVEIFSGDERVRYIYKGKGKIRLVSKDII